MHWPHKHVYKGHTNQSAHYRVIIGLVSHTSPLTGITFCQVSPDPKAVPKPILLQDGPKVQSNHFDSKGQSTLVMNIDPNFMGYTC